MNPFTISKSTSVRKKIIIAGLILNRRKRLNKRKMGRSYMRDLFRNRNREGSFGEYGLLKDLEKDPDYFFKYFRMTKESMEEIFTLIKDDITHPPNHLRPIPAKMRLAIAIRYLATGNAQISVGMGFRVSPSSICVILRETMSAIIKHLKPVYLPTPTHDIWQKSEAIFRERWNFPFCVGAIDGKHIRIKAPWKSGSLNFNYKGFFSIVVLAVASGDYKFLAVDVGAPGSESDAAIFSRSAFLRLAEEKKLQLPENGRLGAEDVPHVIVGDEAFPLKPWLMRPFPGNNLDLAKKVYNYRLSRARRIVENTFGIWASKWQVLFRPIDGDDDLTTMIVWSTIVLHNFLRSKETDHVEEGTEDTTPDNLRNIPRVGTNNYTMAAFSVRDSFANYFVSSEGELAWQYEHVTRSE